VRWGLAIAFTATVLMAPPAAHAATSCSTVPGNLVSDCSFEQPVVGVAGNTQFAPGSSIGAWTVQQRRPFVELTDRRAFTRYPASDGDQAVDLNTSGVEQTLSTQAGGAYRLTFDMSGVPSNHSQCPATDPKRLRVSVGSTTQEFRFQPNHQASPPGDQQFQSHTVDFVAGGNDVLRLNGLNAGCAGPIMDNISVTETSAPPPVLGKSMTALAISGTVLVELPGKKSLKRISSFTSLPVGTIVDARHGRVRLTATSGGQTYAADFYDGEFQITQAAKTGATADLKLFGGNFKGCPKGVRPASAKKKMIRELWGEGSGPFRTIGRFASAAVRGTTWLTADQCTGTLVKVTAGTILVRDFVKRKNIIVRAGHQYLAAAK
jgi:hypothetical protein